jgi:hypothetical protein
MWKIGGSQQNLEGSECLWEQVHFCVFEFIFGNEIMIVKKEKEFIAGFILDYMLLFIWN